MKTQIEVSVIVPVYNAGKYLKQCLESLANQTLRNMEFILVNDGSTDSSPEIMQKYSDADPRFRIFHQENRGLSAARSKGLEKAQGKYVGFTDSDDWILPDMFEKLFRTAEEQNADVVQCGHFFFSSEDGYRIPYNNAPQRDLLKKTNGRLSGAEDILLADASVWNRICRRDMLEKNKISFPPDFRFGEEIYFHFMTLYASRKTVVLPDCLYMYRKDHGKSLTNEAGEHRFCVFKVFRKLFGYFSFPERCSVLPYLNHVELSYGCFACRDLPSLQKRKFFNDFSHLLTMQKISLSAIAYPALCGCTVYDLRYAVLRILHPLTFFALKTRFYLLFAAVIAIREAMNRCTAILQRRKSK